jgi:hypothetical protein
VTQKIKHEEDLPDWFSLAKYDRASELDAFGWYEQLAARETILRELSYLPADDCWLLPRVRESPILDVRRNPPDPWEKVHLHYCTIDLWALACYYTPGLLEGFPRPTADDSGVLDGMTGVRLATIADFGLNYLAMSTDRRRFIKAYLKEGSEVGVELHDSSSPFDAVSSSNAWMSGELTLRVNMVMPDKLLVKEFKRLLKKLRASGSRDVSPRKPLFASWVSHGVLPCLDLRAWELETGVDIVNRVMAYAVYPEGEGGEEEARRTTSRLADRAISDDSLANLVALAAVDIRTTLENLKKKGV